MKRRGLVLAEQLGELAAAGERLGEDVVGGVSVDERGWRHCRERIDRRVPASARHTATPQCGVAPGQASRVTIRQAPSAVQTTSQAMTTMTATSVVSGSRIVLAFGPPPRAEDPRQPVRFQVAMAMPTIPRWTLIR